MEKLKCFILKIGVEILRVIYCAFKWMPEKKKITFLSRQSDKPSIDFIMLKEAIEREKKNYQIVMITEKIKNPLRYCFTLLRQMYHIATSKTVIIDSYCIPVSILKHKKSLCVIQLWHAMGNMKHFGYDMIEKGEGHSKLISEVMCMHKNYTYILISSMDFSDDYIRGFGTDLSKLREIPLPKADCLVSEEYKDKKRKEMYEKYPILKGKKNILYCPTFRKYPTKYDEKKINDLIDQVDFEEYNIIYSPHPVSKVEVNNSKIIKLEESTFDALFVADCIISDYSTVIYEAGLLKVPVYLYAYDWKKYSEKRTFNIDLENDVPTIFSSEPEVIIKAIEQERFDREAFQKFTEKNIRMPQKTCCEEILELIRF